MKIHAPFLSKFLGITKSLAIALLCMTIYTAAPTRAPAADVDLACPDLTRAEQLGTCPTEQELRDQYRTTCPEFMEKRGECKPFEVFARTKNKALWAAISGEEEFLSYMSCTQPSDRVKTAKAVSVEAKCDPQTGRCNALCRYEHDIAFTLRIKGICKTAGGQKLDCASDPQACVVTCELFED
ncbi:hypothetical protein [Magnetovibrio sp.]|uniref:hypothetical protein n=1 Tax=Magnetovibrio sp. TaxID=2024836 RepID=UPI002F93159D